MMNGLKLARVGSSWAGRYGSASRRRMTTLDMPAWVVMSASVGAKVAKGDRLFMMEAMKMQTTVYAQAAGVVAEVNATTGETVEAKDLIVRLRA